jgi:murein DD-endopeptidase MepM/ murein hydrolase activator NlpD
MSTPKKIKLRKILLNNLKHKYRLVFFNDNTFEEVWHLRLSLLNVLSVVGVISFFMIALVIVLLIFTPIRQLFPEYQQNEKLRPLIVKSVLRLDSVERKLHLSEQYFANFNALISGGEPIKYDSLKKTAKNYKNINFNKTIQDSLFRQRIEEEEQFNFVVARNNKPENNISEMHFFPPVKGMITNTFNAKESHFGIDIVGAPNEVVKATLDGTVIIASWTFETGWIIQLQHQNNIISIYKHNANLLKKVGNQVKAGDAIAILGNSGELTTGPHLHFELWHNGKPVNPQDYIIFD